MEIDPNSCASDHDLPPTSLGALLAKYGCAGALREAITARPWKANALTSPNEHSEAPSGNTAADVSPTNR